MAHTTERKIIGSPGYMSPEAVIGAAVDGRADVFSLAATLFELLAGRMPFGGATASEAMMNTIALAAPSVSSLRPPGLDAVPPGVEDLIARALAKEPERRPMMAEFQAGLVMACDALAWAERSGPVAASVMRAVEAPAPAWRPTLSDSGAQVAEMIAKYGPAARPTRPVTRLALLPAPQAVTKPRRSWAVAMALCAATVASLAVTVPRQCQRWVRQEASSTAGLSPAVGHTESHAASEAQPDLLAPTTPDAAEAPAASPEIPRAERRPGARNRKPPAQLGSLRGF